MNSEQERIVKILSEHSFGAPFVFEPDEWRNKGTRHEPADLIWVCNNCIILIFMRSRKPHANEHINQQRRNSDIEHNLKQARGCLSKWKKGKLLSGSNHYSKFEIRFNDCKHIIVLSIIKCGDQVGEYHEQYASDLNVAMCATLPQEALEYFAHMGGNAVDLVNIIAGLKRESKLPDSKIDAVHFVMNYHKISIEQVDPARQLVKSNADLDQIFEFIQRLKYRKGEPERSPQSFDLAKVFNDIPLVDCFRFAIRLKLLFNQTDENRNLEIIDKLSLTHYVILIGIASMANLVKRFQLILNEAEKIIVNMQGGRVILFLYDSDTSVTMIMRPQDGRSYIEELLDTWKILIP